MDNPNKATTKQQWSTPQHEESRPQSLQGAGVARHGGHLNKSGEQAQDGGKQAQEVRHESRWKERTIKQLKRDERRANKQHQIVHDENDEKDYNGEKVKIEKFAFVRTTSSHQVDENIASFARNRKFPKQ